MADDRDEELDALNRELKQASSPYIEKPDELNVGENGMCFINADRFCNASCIAFYDADAAEPHNRCFILQSLGVSVTSLLKKVYPPMTVAPPNYEPPDPMGKRHK